MSKSNLNTYSLQGLEQPEFTGNSYLEKVKTIIPNHIQVDFEYGFKHDHNNVWRRYLKDATAKNSKGDFIFHINFMKKLVTFNENKENVNLILKIKEYYKSTSK